jgi:hypothetical protein
MSIFVDHSENQLPENDDDIDTKSMYLRDRDMLYSEKQYFDASQNVDTPILSDLIYHKHLPCDKADVYNATPLHYACMKNSNYWVSGLLFLNADPNNQISTNGFSCLHEAAKRGYNDVVQKLLDFDAELDIVDNGLYTPLLLAIEEGHAATCKVLLDAGSSMHSMLLDDVFYGIKDKNSQNYLDIKMLLLKHVKDADEVKYQHTSNLWNMKYDSSSPLNLDRVKYVKGEWRSREAASIDNLNRARHQFNEEVKAYEAQNPNIETILRYSASYSRALGGNGSSVYLRALQTKNTFDTMKRDYMKFVHDFYFERGVYLDPSTGILHDAWDIDTDALFDDNLPQHQNQQHIITIDDNGDSHANQAGSSGNSLGGGSNTAREGGSSAARPSAGRGSTARPSTGRGSTGRGNTTEDSTGRGSTGRGNTAGDSAGRGSTAGDSSGKSNTARDNAVRGSPGRGSTGIDGAGRGNVGGAVILDDAARQHPGLTVQQIQQQAFAEYHRRRDHEARVMAHLQHLSRQSTTQHDHAYSNNGDFALRPMHQSPGSAGQSAGASPPMQGYGRPISPASLNHNLQAMSLQSAGQSASSSPYSMQGYMHPSLQAVGQSANGSPYPMQGYRRQPPQSAGQSASSSPYLMLGYGRPISPTSLNHDLQAMSLQSAGRGPSSALLTSADHSLHALSADRRPSSVGSSPYAISAGQRPSSVGNSPHAISAGQRPNSAGPSPSRDPTPDQGANVGSIIERFRQSAAATARRTEEHARRQAGAAELERRELERRRAEADAEARRRAEAEARRQAQAAARYQARKLAEATAGESRDESDNARKKR